MEKFRILVNEVKNQSHSAKQFLVAHGISNKALMIPLYYPAERCNVVLQGPAKDSPWLKDGKISPKDKVLVRKVTEEYTEPGDEPGQGNFYKKEKDKEVIELTVDEFIEEIYNAPENRETEEDMNFEYLDTGEFETIKVNIADGGQGYSVGNKLVLPGDVSDGMIKVTEVDDTGKITKIEVEKPALSSEKTDELIDLIPTQYNQAKGQGASVRVEYQDKGIASTLSSMKQYNDDKKEKAKQEFENFTKELQHFGTARLLNDLNLPQNRNGDILFNKISEPTKAALSKLKTAYKLGIDMDDEYANFLVWEAKNNLVFEAIKEKISKNRNKEERKELAHRFKKQKKEWFRSGLNPKEVIKAANSWWKSLTGSSIQKKEESTLVEFGGFNSNPKPISMPYTDAKIDKYLYELFGKDSVRFKTVPIINKPYNPDDPDADPTEKLLIRGIVDINDLSDNGLIRVVDTVSGETRKINIGDLREIINRPENQGTRLDTDEYRRTAGHQFNTLNPGYGGKFVTLPEKVVMQMLETMQNDEEGDYRYDYTMIDLIKKYKEELKDPSKHRDIVLLALQDYNGYDYRQYQIRYSPSENVYKGLMEYEGHITAPVSHIWKGGN